MHTHHGLYDSVFGEDEARDNDRDRDLAKSKLTFTECIIALLIALTCVSLHAVFLGSYSNPFQPVHNQKVSRILCQRVRCIQSILTAGLLFVYLIVEEIEPIVTERGISDSFMGLILVPLVEKVAEHLTAVDEAWDNQMNLALTHVLGATIQTALFNSSLVVIVGWGLGKAMDLNFEVFNIVVLILAIIVVGNFLRDQKSNYLEGSLCILVYMLVGKYDHFLTWLIRSVFFPFRPPVSRTDIDPV